MSIVTNSINMNKDAPQPVGDAASASWSFTGPFSITSPAENISISCLSFSISCSSSLLSSDSSGNFTINGTNLNCNVTNGINLEAGNGFMVCHSAVGSSYVDDVAIASDAPNFNFARNTATSMFFGNLLCVATMQFSTLDCSSNTSLQFNSPTINIGNFGATTALNLGNGSCTTKLILPTPAVSANTPLLIDPDGTIHV